LHLSQLARESCEFGIIPAGVGHVKGMKTMSELIERLSQVNLKIQIMGTHILLGISFNHHQHSHYGFIQINLLNGYLINKNDYSEIVACFNGYYAENGFYISVTTIYDGERNYFLDENKNLKSAPFIPPDFTGGYEQFLESEIDMTSAQEDPMIMDRPLLPRQTPIEEWPDDLDPDTAYFKLTDHFHYGGGTIEGTDLPPEYGGPDPQK